MTLLTTPQCFPLSRFSRLACVRALALGALWCVSLGIPPSAFATHQATEVQVNGFWPQTNTNSNFVLVFGAGFSSEPPMVKVGTTASAYPPQVYSDSMLAFVLPNANSTGKITVTTTRGSATSAYSFGTVRTNLEVNAVWDHYRGCIFDRYSDVIRVIGSGFADNATVLIGGVTQLTQRWDSGLLIVSPKSASGPITVNNPATANGPGNSFTTSDSFTISPLRPRPINLVRTTVDYANDKVTLTGLGKEVETYGTTSIAQGESAVEPCAEIKITNLNNNKVQTELASPDGTFITHGLDASPNDPLPLSVLVRYPNNDSRASTFSEYQNGSRVTYPATTALTVLEDPRNDGIHTPVCATFRDAGAIVELTPFTDSPCISEEKLIPLDPALGESAMLNYPGSTRFRVIYPQDLTKGPFPVVMFVHGGYGGFATVPSYRGYGYLMHKLASQGFFTISINYEVPLPPAIKDASGNIIEPAKQPWDLVQAYLGFLNNTWNASGGRFSGKLATEDSVIKVALVGHSQGGEVTMQTWKKIAATTTGAPAKIKAMVGIAPFTHNDIYLTKSPYLMLAGLADGYEFNHFFGNYDRAYTDPASGSMVSSDDVHETKSVALVSGANHNNFNTLWELSDTTYTLFPGFAAITAIQQQDIAVSTLAAFMRWHLKLDTNYRDFLAGRHRFASMPSAGIYWTRQDPHRLVVDDFQNTLAWSKVAPNTKNKLGGDIIRTGFTSAWQCKPLHYYCKETLSNASNLPNELYHVSTGGIKLSWTAGATYRTQTVAGTTLDLSSYKYFSLRAAKLADQVPASVEKDLNLIIRLVDDKGQYGEASSNRYDVLRRPFHGGYTLLTGVRIPLEHFTMNNYMVDLKRIVAIEIMPEDAPPGGNGIVAVDDIEFQEWR